jgi:hypothetical protein
MSKRGLSARLYAANQTLIMVNTGLPKGFWLGNGGGRLAEIRPKLAFRAPKYKTAHLLSRDGRLGRHQVYGAFA